MKYINGLKQSKSLGIKISSDLKIKPEIIIKSKKYLENLNILLIDYYIAEFL